MRSFLAKECIENHQELAQHMTSWALKEVLLAQRDVIVSIQIRGSKLLRVFHIRWRMLAAQFIGISLPLNEVFLFVVKNYYDVSEMFSELCPEVLPDISSAFLAGRKVLPPNFTSVSHQRFLISNRIASMRFTTHFCKHGHPSNLPQQVCFSLSVPSPRNLGKSRGKWSQVHAHSVLVKIITPSSQKQIRAKTN